MRSKHKGMDTLSAMILHLQIVDEEMRVTLNNSYKFVILFRTRWLVDKNSPSIWTYDDFESLSVEVLNHLTRRKLGKDFTFVSLS